MYLNIAQVEEIVTENLYTYKGNPYISRPFCGSYANSPSLPSLSMMGGDIGELIILYSASYTYGFEVDFDLAWNTLGKIVGGPKNLTFMNDTKHPQEAYLYINFVLNDPETYNLDQTGKLLISKHINRLGIQVPAISEKRIKREQALIILNGEEGLLPQYSLDTPEGIQEAQLLIFQKSQVDRRHRAYANELVNQDIVKLYSGLDDEYLYEVLSETTDVHLYETVAKIDPQLPIFSAEINNKGKVVLEQYR